MWKIFRSVCFEVGSNVFLLTNLSQLKIIASLGDEENKEQQKIIPLLEIIPFYYFIWRFIKVLNLLRIIHQITGDMKTLGIHVSFKSFLPCNC